MPKITTLRVVAPRGANHRKRESCPAAAAAQPGMADARASSGGGLLAETRIGRQPPNRRATLGASGRGAGSSRTLLHQTTTLA
jgi:hypothetical protein